MMIAMQNNSGLISIDELSIPRDTLHFFVLDLYMLTQITNVV